MKTIKIIILIFILAIVFMLKGNLLAQSSQTFKKIRVNKDEKKYAESLLLENAGIDEIVKILAEHTGAKIIITRPPVKNKKMTVEFHFDKSGKARKLVWYGKKATVKTYITSDDEEKAPVEVNITSKADSKSGIHIKIGEKISVEYRNIKLEELLKRFSELGTGTMTFRLDDEVKKKNIRVNLTMKNFTPEDALKALASLENLVIRKLDDNVYLVTQKKSPGE